MFGSYFFDPASITAVSNHVAISLVRPASYRLTRYPIRAFTTSIPRLLRHQTASRLFFSACASFSQVTPSTRSITVAAAGVVVFSASATPNPRPPRSHRKPLVLFPAPSASPLSFTTLLSTTRIALSDPIQHSSRID